jgi:hypothetical protein
LKEVGFVDNFWAIDNRISVRLGAIIFTLKSEGWIFDDDKSGFLDGTKNWRYLLKVGVRQPYMPKFAYQMQLDGTMQEIALT